MYSDIGLICWSILAMMAEFEWVSMPVPQGRANLLPFDLWQIFINVKFSLNNLSCCSCCSGSGPQRACWHGRQDVFGEVWFQGGIFCRGKFGCFGLILFDIGILFHLIAACLLVNSGNKSKPWSSFQAFRGAWDVWWHVMIFWYTTQLLVLADNESRFGNFYFAPATTTLPGHDDWIESCHCAEVLTIALTAPLCLRRSVGILAECLMGTIPVSAAASLHLAQLPSLFTCIANAYWKKLCTLQVGSRGTYWWVSKSGSPKSPEMICFFKEATVVGPCVQVYVRWVHEYFY